MFTNEVFAEMLSNTLEQAKAFDAENANKLTIGEFGTCGDSQWRVPFNELYDKQMVRYFNPQLAPGVWETAPDFYMQAEAWHALNDQIILIPITSESYGIRSLGEVGITIAHAQNSETDQDVIIMIDKDIDSDLEKDAEMAKLSKSMRKLTLNHLFTLRDLEHVHIVESLDSMLDLSLVLWDKHFTAKEQQRKLSAFYE